jgi:hypothetical protein
MDSRFTKLEDIVEKEQQQKVGEKTAIWANNDR